MKTKELRLEAHVQEAFVHNPRLFSLQGSHRRLDNNRLGLLRSESLQTGLGRLAEIELIRRGRRQRPENHRSGAGTWGKDALRDGHPLFGLRSEPPKLDGGNKGGLRRTSDRRVGRRGCETLIFLPPPSTFAFFASSASTPCLNSSSIETNIPPKAAVVFSSSFPSLFFPSSASNLFKTAPAPSSSSPSFSIPYVSAPSSTSMSQL